jgi:uncharacterized protein GlcG (DUF336 family)
VTSLSLARATAIVDATLDHARRIGAAPLTVALLDGGGHLIVLKREDESGILRPQIAQAKAWGALGMGLGTRTLAGRARDNPAFFAALASVSDGRMVPAPGGVLIRDENGMPVGALGVSGDRSEVDEACAVAGIEHAGLHADPGQD